MARSGYSALHGVNPNELCKFSNIYLEHYRQQSAAVSQWNNDHMQVNIIVMEGK